MHLAKGNKSFWASQVPPWWRIFLPIQEPQETQVRSLGWEDSLEKEMSTHSSILAWKTPHMEEPGGLQSNNSNNNMSLDSWNSDNF